MHRCLLKWLTLWNAEQPNVSSACLGEQQELQDADVFLFHVLHLYFGFFDLRLWWVWVMFCFLCVCSLPPPFPIASNYDPNVGCGLGGGLFELECHQFLDSFSSFKRIGMLAQKQWVRRARGWGTGSSQVALATTHNVCNSSHGDGFQGALSAGDDSWSQGKDVTDGCWAPKGWGWMGGGSLLLWMLIRIQKYYPPANLICFQMNKRWLRKLITGHTVCIYECVGGGGGLLIRWRGFTTNEASSVLILLVLCILWSHDLLVWFVVFVAKFLALPPSPFLLRYEVI